MFKGVANPELPLEALETWDLIYFDPIAGVLRGAEPQPGVLVTGGEKQPTGFRGERELDASLLGYL